MFWKPSLYFCCVMSPLFLITPATVHVFRCVFYIFLYSYEGSKKLARLLFFLRPSGSTPLFVCLLLCGLVRFVVLGVPQLQVIFVPLHLRPQTLLRQPSLALDTLDLPLVEVMDGDGGKASDP